MSGEDSVKIQQELLEWRKRMRMLHPEVDHSHRDYCSMFELSRRFIRFRDVYRENDR